MGILEKMRAATQGVSTKGRGDAAEDVALAYLLKAGLELLTRNYRTPGRGGGEIDLVMKAKDGTVVFIEVRSRMSAGYGGAGASIGAVKQQRVILAARHYLMRWPAPPPCRFDAVLIDGTEVQWLRAAFESG
jgi:putative endonuclease